ncbi:MXAN_6577-like cysteine-rich protein [Vulgatibacter sp.]|uniref:MXAN_6577-like cysteine-rich protein n=1 Tax=Vulgatibacter sp. TaxID=1971226 RepID=UPI003566DD18
MKTLVRLLPLLCIALLAGCDDGEPVCASDVYCDGQCTDVGLDKTNCGGCGNVCGTGLECVDGACVCAGGEALCGGSCVVVAQDERHCGGCDNTCGTAQLCTDGACTCTGDETACGTSCVDTQSDVRNCGACGTTCGTGEICEAGACVTGACTGLECDVEGTILCIDPMTDEDNCGACGTICGAGETCTDGACVFTCAEGIACEVAGSMQCVDDRTDEQNCGGCGVVCGGGTSCLGGVCAVGNLYAACFTDGSVVPLLKATNAVTSPKATGIDGPQSLALYGDDLLLAIGSLDQTLYVLDRATMRQVGSVVVGAAPNQVIVRGTKAYVVASGSNSISVVDLADPAAPRVSDAVALGENINPMSAAFDSAGTLWVSSWLADVVIPVDFSGAVGVKGDAVALELTGVEGKAYPAGVAVVRDVVYVALNNLDGEYAPAGNGRLGSYNPETGAKALIDLGSTCTNAGYLAADGDLLYVACTDSYWQGEVAILDTTTGTVTNRIATGGGPSQISLDPTAEGRFFVADAGGMGFFAVEADGTATKVDVCPVVEAGWEFNSDVLAAP